MSSYPGRAPSPSFRTVLRTFGQGGAGPPSTLLTAEDSKRTLKMDGLRGKTPERLRREIWAHLLAYNLTRQVMAQAALRAGLPPRRISFAGAKQTLDVFRAALQGGEGDVWRRQVEAMLTAVAAHRVGQRDGRYEPRQVKRRPKVFPMMTKPRGVARAALVTGEGDNMKD